MVVNVGMIILQFIIIIIILVFQSFLKTKGENWATKQDIEKITNQIEKVKYQYAQYLEEDRLIAQSVQSLYLKRDSIAFELFEVSTKLYNILRNIKFDFYILEIDREFEETVYNLSSDIVSNRAKISVLFSDDTNLDSKADNLASVVIRCSTLFSILSQEVSHIHSKLAQEKVCININNEMKILDVDKMICYRNEIGELINKYTHGVYDFSNEFEYIRKDYLKAVHNYYENMKGLMGNHHNSIIDNNCNS